MRIIKPENLKDLTFKKAMKKPITIRCVQINEHYEMDTMKGNLRQK